MASQRFPAVACSVRELLEARLEPGQGWEPATLLVGDEMARRINLIGLVVGTPADGAVVVDDGSGRVLVRHQQGSPQIGDTLLTIGMANEAQNERFVSAEIIKVLPDPAWLRLRQRQLDGRQAPPPEKKETTTTHERERAHEERLEQSTHERIASLIERLDEGKGADIDAVIDNAGIKGCERIVQAMIERGEIFETRPGWVKVLR